MTVFFLVFDNLFYDVDSFCNNLKNATFFVTFFCTHFENKASLFHL